MTFEFVEAYHEGKEHDAACKHQRTVFSTEEAEHHQHSVVQEFDYIHPFKAAYNAFCLRGEIVLSHFGRKVAKEQSKCEKRGPDSDVSSHVQDRWCDLRSDWPIGDMASPRIREKKPNPGIIEDDDSVLPFRHRSSDGSVVSGRTIAPLNWARNLFFRTAAGNGAVYRDDDGELRVLVRTWIAAVRTQLILPHRDIVVRAQLFGEIEAKVRRAWRDQIGRRDSLTITAVRPSPNIGYSGQRPIHLLVELNRRRDSMMYPVLLAFREIDENGPSAHIQWFPTLLASPVGTTTLHNVGAPPCGREQLLIPLPGRTEPPYTCWIVFANLVGCKTTSTTTKCI